MQTFTKRQAQVLGIYVRVSTAKQAEKGLSMQDQERRGIELAKQFGYQFEVFREPAVSAGLPFMERPVLADLMTKVYKGKVHALFTVEIDRMTRDATDGNILLSELIAKETRLFDTTGEVDIQNENVELYTRIKILFADAERRSTRRKVKRVLAGRAEMGLAPGGPLKANGYTKNEKKELIIDESEVSIIKLIYKLALEGKGTKVIANILNEKGIPTKRMKATTGRGMNVRGEKKMDFLWRDSVVYTILTNPLYKGERIYSGKTYKAPAIIDPIVFDAVQQQLASRNQFKDTTNKYNYLLKGLIVCPICGGKIQGKKRANGKDNCYTCTSNRYGPNCGNRGINIEFLEKLVTDNILDLDKIVDAALAKSEVVEKNKRYTRQADDVKKKLKQTETELDNIIKFIKRGKETDRLLKEMDNLENQKAAYIELLESYDRELTLVGHKDNLLEAARNAMKEFKKLKGFDERTHFIQNLLPRITVGWDGENQTYDIVLSFRLSQLENYLIAKQLVVNRNGRKDGKAITKVLSSNITIENIVVVDEDLNFEFAIPSANHTSFIQKHQPRARVNEKRKYA